MQEVEIEETYSLAILPSRATSVCGATTMQTINGSSVSVPVNPLVCDTSLSDTCKVGECEKLDGAKKRWSDSSANYGTSNWGGDNQCTLPDGSFKSECNNKLAAAYFAGVEAMEAEYQSSRGVSSSSSEAIPLSNIHMRKSTK